MCLSVTAALTTCFRVRRICSWVRSFPDAAFRHIRTSVFRIEDMGTDFSASKCTSMIWRYIVLVFSSASCL